MVLEYLFVWFCFPKMDNGLASKCSYQFHLYIIKCFVRRVHIDCWIIKYLLGNILNGYKCRSGHILHVGIPNNEQMYKGCQVRVGYGDQHEVYTLTYLTRQHRGVAQGLHPHRTTKIHRQLRPFCDLHGNVFAATLRRRRASYKVRGKRTDNKRIVAEAYGVFCCSRGRCDGWVCVKDER